MTKTDPTTEALAAARESLSTWPLSLDGFEQIARAMDEFAAERVAILEARLAFKSVDASKYERLAGKHEGESSRLRAERDRLREALEKMRVYAFKQYWNGRGYLDAIDGWIRGDDGPVYPLLKVSEFATAALSPEPGAETEEEKCPACGCGKKPPKGSWCANAFHIQRVRTLEEVTRCPSCPHPAHQWRVCNTETLEGESWIRVCRCTHGAESGAPQSESAAPREDRE